MTDDWSYVPYSGRNYCRLDYFDQHCIQKMFGRKKHVSKVNEEECEEEDCGTYGCNALLWYSVRLCNTVSFARSSVVLQNITHRILKEGTCKVVKK